MGDVQTVADAIGDAIETAISNWTPPTGYTLAGVLRDNDPPLGTKTGTTAANPRTGFWARVAVGFGAGDLAEINSDISHSQGRAVAALFIPLGGGTDSWIPLFEAVRNAVQGQKIGTAYMGPTEGPSFGATPDNTWFAITASTPFRFESTPA